MKLRRRIGWRVVIALAVLALLDALVLGGGAAGFRINKTASMPVGLYRVGSLGPGRLERGMVVAICPSGSALQVGTLRGYLRPGPCREGVEPLLKRVEAIAGDSVNVSDLGVRINGNLLPNSARVAHDCDDRPVPRIRVGQYRLRPGQVWLYAPVSRSWDSRYFGPQAAADIIGIATPVLIVGEGKPCGG